MNRAQILILTEEEAALGFRLLVVKMDDLHCDPVELVVAYILNESDLIVKTFDDDRIAYKHRRWGVMEDRVNTDSDDEDLGWHPLGRDLYYEPAEAVQRGEYEPDELSFAPIQPRKFHYEPYNPEIHDL